MKKVAYLLKTSDFLYTVYYYTFSCILRILGVFIRTDDKVILFNSFGGKKANDSPRAIFQEMKKDKRFADYRLVWALQDPEQWDGDEIEIVKSDTYAYFCTALKAKVWITNSSIERGLNFKKKSTICFNTWHGSAIKKMGIDIQSNNESFRSKVNVRADVMLAQSQYDVDIFSHAFQLPVEQFRCIGLPRNDVLANCTENKVMQVKEKLGISAEKRVLLYAPTFREYTKGKEKEIVLDIPINLEYWQEKLGENYIVLFRAHYEVAKHMEVCSYPVFKDVSDYQDLNDLMIVSDALISDYSSIFFDYSIMHKPMYCFAYDNEKYTEKRGMYINLKEELPCIMHEVEETLITDIMRGTTQTEEKRREIKAFQKKFVTEYGSAAKKSCDILYEELQRC